MTRDDAIHIVDVAFNIPLAVRRSGEDRTYHEAEIREAKRMAITALSQEQQSEWERDHEILKAYADGQESMKPCKDAISRQAVIDYFNSVFSDEFIPFDRARMFIDGIYHAVPSVTPQPCKDAISREEVLDEINRIGVKAFETYNDYSELFDFVDSLPSVSTEKTGRWITIDYQRDYFKCSECNSEGVATTVMHKPVWKYCPNCGAKMEVENG